MGRFNEFGPLGDVGFGRPFGGVYAGPYGGLDYSMFGPPMAGPFNNPLFRGERILKIFDTNRKVNKSPDQATSDPNRKTIADLYAAGEIDLDPDYFFKSFKKKSSEFLTNQKNDEQYDYYLSS